MGKVIKEIYVDNNGELYCNSLTRKMKKRLVSVKNVENIHRKGTETIPVFVREEGKEGIFEFSEEEKDELMKMVKERINIIRNSSSSTFRDSIAVDTSRVNTNIGYNDYNAYDYEEER